MELDITKLKEILEIVSTLATVITIVLGYKILIYDANKKKAEIGMTNAEKVSIEEQAEKTQMEMVGVLISSSKELIGIYKEIIEKLESTIKFQENELSDSRIEREALKIKFEQVLKEKDACHNEILTIKKQLGQMENKLKELGELNGKH